MTSLRRVWIGLCILLGFGLVAVNFPASAKDKKKIEKKDDKKEKEPEKKEPPKLDTPLQSFKGHGNWILGLAYSQDGANLVSISRDKTAKVWDVKSGKDTHTLKALPTEPKGMAVLGPNLRVAISTGKWDAKKKDWLGEIKIWDGSAGKDLPSIKGQSDTPEGLGLAASRDGKKLAAASMENLVKIWDVEAGKEIRTLKGHTDQVLAVAFSSNGKLIASTGKVKSVAVVAPPDKKDKKGKKDKKDPPKDVKSPPPGNDKALILWDADTGKEITTYKGFGRDVTCVAFSPDGTKIAAGSLDGTIKIFEAQENGKLLHSLKAPEGVWTVAFSKDGKKLASGGWERLIKIWDVEKGTDLRTIIAHSGTVITLAFSPDGNFLASGGQDQLINIWSLAEKK